MTDPNDFDPIAASLRRQFSPPPLDSVEQRVADEAERLEAEAAGDGAVVFIPQDAPPRRSWMVAVGFFAAAALVLLLLRPWSSDSPGPSTPSVAETLDPPVVVPPTASQRAGHQLDGFLSRADALPADAECMTPPEVCDTEAGYPHLPADAPLQQLGECGGQTEAGCEEFDLPADRALLVRLSTGEHAIVCIERPWTDPKPELPPASGYNIFRRELGDYILYEVTPRAAPEASRFVRL